MNWYFEVLKKYAVFSGRAHREEYWMFFLINSIFECVMITLDVLTKQQDVLFFGFYSLMLIIPSMSAGVRRLHDSGRSGWWLLFPLVNLILLMQESQEGDNKFGRNPKIDLTDAPSNLSDGDRFQPSAKYYSPQAKESRLAIDTLAMPLNPAPSRNPSVDSAKSEVINSANTDVGIDEDKIYEVVANELETGNTQKGLWTKIYAQCAGDETQVKVKYIQQRAAQLVAAEKLAQSAIAAEQERQRQLDFELRIASLEADKHTPYSQNPVPEEQLKLMELLGISFDGDKYQYLEYRYDHFNDALNYAKRNAGNKQTAAKIRVINCNKCGNINQGYAISQCVRCGADLSAYGTDATPTRDVTIPHVCHKCDAVNEGYRETCFRCGDKLIY